MRFTTSLLAAALLFTACADSEAQGGPSAQGGAAGSQAGGGSAGMAAHTTAPPSRAGGAAGRASQAAAGGPSQAGGGQAGSASTCTSHRDCQTFEGRAVCVDGACLPARSEQCNVVHGSLDDDGLVVGFLGPLSGELAAVGEGILAGATLAFDELSSSQQGGAAPRLSLVACDDSQAPEAALSHLTTVLRVRAIIGPALSRTYRDVVPIGTEGGVLFVSPSATSPTLDEVSDHGLAVRLAPSDAAQATPLSMLAAHLDAEARAERGITDATPRVAVVVRKGPYGEGIAAALLPRLEAQSPQGGGVLRVDVADSDEPDDAANAADAVIAFAPRVVVLLGLSEGPRVVAPLIEQGAPSAEKPRYLFADGGRGPHLSTLVGDDEGLRRRVMGVGPGAKQALYEAFRTRHLASRGEPGIYAEHAYDALYAIVYAASAGEGSIDAGLSRLQPPASPLDVGPPSIGAALEALSSGGAIDLRGASGDLDIVSGKARARLDVWCLVRDDDGRATAVSSGATYDEASSSLSGTIACP